MWTRYNDKEYIDYECVKAITKALRKTFKGIQSNSYGFCCNSDYDFHHKYINNDDYVCAKVYKGGLNNDYNYNYNRFELGTKVWFSWNLTEFDVDEVVKTMNDVAHKWGCEVIKPLNEDNTINTGKCITLQYIQEVA